jgi:hypothetical protein
VELQTALENYWEAYASLTTNLDAFVRLSFEQQSANYKQAGKFFEEFWKHMNEYVPMEVFTGCKPAFEELVRSNF